MWWSPFLSMLLPSVWWPPCLSLLLPSMWWSPWPDNSKQLQWDLGHFLQNKATWLEELFAIKSLDILYIKLLNGILWDNWPRPQISKKAVFTCQMEVTRYSWANTSHISSGDYLHSDIFHWLCSPTAPQTVSTRDCHRFISPFPCQHYQTGYCVMLNAWGYLHCCRISSLRHLYVWLGWCSCLAEAEDLLQPWLQHLHSSQTSLEALWVLLHCFLRELGAIDKDAMYYW